MRSSDIDQLYRDNFGKLVTSLVSYFGLPNIALAEDLVQETFLAAVERWSENPPADPVAWLFKVCKHKAINHLNKSASKLTTNSTFDKETISEEYKLDQLLLPHEIKDNQLRMLFAFCHPELSNKVQVMLTLRMIAGFRPEEIARGLGLTVEAVKKTLVRARQKIKDRSIRLKVPYVMQSKSRLENVHAVLYLIFSEGYSATSGEYTIRQDLCLESLRLLESLLAMDNLHNTNSYALKAIILFNMARFPSREAADGSIIDLERQDRSLWDKSIITAGFACLKHSRSGNQMSAYHLEAAIASIHCASKTYEETNWFLILALYEKLYDIKPSPYIWLNRCIAIYQCHGAAPALDALLHAAPKNQLEGYHLYHVTLGKLYLEMDESSSAKSHFDLAIGLTKVKAEKEYIKSLMV